MREIYNVDILVSDRGAEFSIKREVTVGRESQIWGAVRGLLLKDLHSMGLSTNFTFKITSLELDSYTL